MNSAKLEKSPRLKKVADLLADGREHSTMEIVMRARVCAVNSIVAELRDNGLDIQCRRTVSAERDPVWLYRMGGAA